jgi:hypothetical protein
MLVIEFQNLHTNGQHILSTSILKIHMATICQSFAYDRQTGQATYMDKQLYVIKWELGLTIALKKTKIPAIPSQKQERNNSEHSKAQSPLLPGHFLSVPYHRLHIVLCQPAKQ